MIVTVTKLKEYVTTTLSDDELGEKLQALEIAIRKYTNNKFQNRAIRFISETDTIQTPMAAYLKIGDTLEVSESAINNGLYTIESITDEILGLNEPIYSEPSALFTKIEYPADIQMGAIEIMRWKLKNEEQNYDPTAEKDVQSESISRHSVTYAKDTTESDLSIEFGVPKKYVAFLLKYKKARF